MVLVSYSGREINAKLVYYGPGLSGKTTNLEYIYGSIPQGQRGKMVSMKTKTERTLFFDFLPVNLGELAGFKTRFLLYTVPGQVYYNATRKLVLKGVDAVVFVADSARGKMDENVESLENLKENLKELGLSLESVPWVLQYNKRDMPDVYTVEELQQVLNPGGVPSFEAVAKSGLGVVDTFKAVSRLLLAKLSKDVGVLATIPSTEEIPSDDVGSGPAPTPSLESAPEQTPAPAPMPAPASESPAPIASPAETPVVRSEASPEPVSPQRFEMSGQGATEPAAWESQKDGLDDSSTRAISVGERLRRWLSRPQPGEEAETPPSNEETLAGPAETPVFEDPWLGSPVRETAPLAQDSEPSTAGPEPASVSAALETAPAGNVPAAQPEAPSLAEAPFAGRDWPIRRGLRSARKPREVIVPLELTPSDLETGIVIRLAIQTTWVSEDDSEEDEEGDSGHRVA